jgi:Pentapeptide repeats (8 copies)
VYLYGLKASLSGATTVLANFANAYLTGLDLSSVRDKQMQGATFTGACLANCNCRGTDFTDYRGKSVSLSKACLQGADFSDATLFGAVMVDAAVATEAGKLQATLNLHGTPQVIPISYKPTVIPPNATNGQTKCPSRATGPCTGSKLVSPAAPMTVWPSKAKLPTLSEAVGMAPVAALEEEDQG